MASSQQDKKKKHKMRTESIEPYMVVSLKKPVLLGWLLCR